MAIELKMPALSPSMEKGKLARWLVATGDPVKRGDMIAEIETDKATMEFEATDEGWITGILVPAGTDDVTVGTVIAMLSNEASSQPADPAGQVATESVIAVPAVAANPSPPAIVAAATPPVAQPRRAPPADRIKVSPLAQRIAKARDIDLSGLAGTGPNGRIVRADLGVGPLVAPAAVALAAPARPVPAFALPPTGVPTETIKLTGMRKTIARRLSESKQTVPHFYLTIRCNIDALLQLRGELNATLAARGIKLSVNDMVIRAMALALREVPDANVQFGGEELYRFGRVDISVAVAIDGGLITPIIKDAASLSLSAIAHASKTLAGKAREGKLVPEEYQGGTASLSNLGMYGIDEMLPVINLPQALILGVGAGVEQPWKVDGQVRLATIMAATGSFDHRAIDGAVAAQFMASFRSLIEHPLLIAC